MLRGTTNGFVDAYESANFDSTPGLLMNTTDKQHEILLKLHTRMDECIGYSLELELLVTLGSIHSWLVKTTACANKFFTVGQLKLLEEYKYDMKAGSKVKFVLSLVFRVMPREKVLIFCHNLAPAIARAFRPGQEKMVYVYQLLATGTLEEDKYIRTTWKEWVTSMIFSEAFEENPSHSRA
ncbi:hypothetical protein JHK87_032087 [Glycine soja]|nr:hypothetical protein JHK87_032087 [Glycine soja]